MSTEDSLSNFLSWTFADAMAQLKEFKWKEEPRPAIYKSCTLLQSNKSIQVQSSGYIDFSNQLNLKYCYIQGQKLEVATLMIYPISTIESYPIFAAEWVLVGNKLHILVLDLEACGQNLGLNQKIEKVVAKSYSKYLSFFPYNKHSPEWFEAIKGPCPIFSSADLDLLESIRAAYNEYLELTISNFYYPILKQVAADSFEESTAILAYKKHHYEHSPARPLLKNSEWSEPFLRDYHFGKALI